MKSIFFLENNRVEIISCTEMELIARVTGLHSSDIDDYEGESTGKIDPYTVMIRNNGEHTCTCLSFVHAIKEYKQFWGDLAIRSTPECSHVMAVKISPAYKQWILKDQPNAEELAVKPMYLKSYVRTSGTQVIPAMPTDLSKIDPVRKHRKVNFEELTK